jgi:hypothetical protein
LLAAMMPARQESPTPFFSHCFIFVTIWMRQPDADAPELKRAWASSPTNCQEKEQRHENHPRAKIVEALSTAITSFKRTRG